MSLRTFEIAWMPRSNNALMYARKAIKAKFVGFIEDLKVIDGVENGFSRLRNLLTVGSSRILEGCDHTNKNGISP
jgi:hypothetical protein